ncbi:nitronate monooxygenase [Lipingzhangella halophila]|uniref:Propionate 3-nitronate monooxygenase n=1 Tax=Lipingzhangella halophila TaxID=1783352 RepID=A0A7W7W2Q1_9ACTN|nr:nitronate monooxygenase [Lipingzhangella halophila]MBB4931996.1 nitronate monooxygenase [Lipingzhangella halophila]
MPRTPDFDTPIVAAPMAGGVSTPELVAAVNQAGGLGFLAAGYTSAAQMGDLVRTTRELTRYPFGVNVFVPGPDRFDPLVLDSYRTRLLPEAERLGTEPGRAHWSDDDYQAKLAALTADPVGYVSFTFNCPAAADIAALRAAGTTVIVTVTSSGEARTAADAGADMLCVQGAEAGGHQGSFDDTQERTTPLLELLATVRAAVEVPLLAAGGIATRGDVRAAVAAGAVAAQVGTALLRTPESGANRTHKDALADARFTSTAVTRAFSGRRARGLANRFLREHGPAAPAAYPHVHYLTGPIRAAAARAADPETLHMWAGTGFRAAAARPAGDIVAELAAGE